MRRWNYIVFHALAYVLPGLGVVMLEKLKEVFAVLHSLLYASGEEVVERIAMSNW